MHVCAEIIDNIIDHTDTTNTRLIRETRHIKVLDRKSGACCMFLQTLFLVAVFKKKLFTFCCVITVSFCFSAAFLQH